MARLQKRGGCDSSGRCASCGLSSEGSDPEALTRRAERLLSLAEGIAVKADLADDARLALLAVDKARQSLELLMKAAGVLRPDGAVTVNVALDASRRVDAWLGSLPAETLRAFVAGACPKLFPLFHRRREPAGHDRTASAAGLGRLVDLALSAIPATVFQIRSCPSWRPSSRSRTVKRHTRGLPAEVSGR